MQGTECLAHHDLSNPGQSKTWCMALADEHVGQVTPTRCVMSYTAVWDPPTAAATVDTIRRGSFRVQL